MSLCVSPLIFGAAMHKMTISWPGVRGGASAVRLAGHALESMCALVVLGCSAVVCLYFPEKQRPTRCMAYSGFFVWGVGNAGVALGEIEAPLYVMAVRLLSMSTLCVFLQATCLGHVSVLLVALVVLPDLCALGTAGMPLAFGTEGSTEFICNIVATALVAPAMQLTTSFAHGWKSNSHNSLRTEGGGETSPGPCQGPSGEEGVADVGCRSTERPLQISSLSGQLVLELAAEDIAGLTLAAVKSQVSKKVGVQPQFLELVSQHRDVTIGSGEEGSICRQCMWPHDVRDACVIVLPERCEGITTPTSFSCGGSSRSTDNESGSSADTV